MADEQQAGAGCAAFGEQQAQERLAAVRIQRRSGLVGDHQLGLADQRTGGGDPLLLADGERRGRLRAQFGGQAQIAQQALDGGDHAAIPFLGAALAQARETTGQRDVFGHREKGQQIELLEDVAGMLDPEAVPGCRAEAGEILAEQTHLAASRHLHAAKQAEQGGLAAAGRSAQEHALPAPQLEGRNVQQLRLAGPGEADLDNVEQEVGRHVQNCRTGLRAFRVWPFWPRGPISCTSSSCSPG